jgi:hypothetical protein
MTARRAVVLATAAAVLALPAAGATALGPSAPRPPADPGQFRLLTPADRSASLWGNRWLGFADAFTSWLEEAFRPHPEKLAAPARSARLERRWTSGPGTGS